jgi:cytoskeletal protein CcmA (bactofilin family)
MDTSVRAHDASPLSISTIGEDLTITGNVTSKGELHLNGKVQGDVHCVALVLGENAQLEGSVIAEDVTVRGRLIGSMSALTVTLKARSYIEGHIFYKTLAIAQGAHFDGESHPSEDPLSANPEVPASEPQLIHNGLLDAVNHRGSVKGFIRSLPKSRSA